jgi:hypothetical protein
VTPHIFSHRGKESGAYRKYIVRLSNKYRVVNLDKESFAVGQRERVYEFSRNVYLTTVTRMSIINDNR